MKIKIYKKNIQTSFEEVVPFFMEAKDYFYELKIPKKTEQCHYLSAKSIETVYLIKKIIEEYGTIHNLNCLVFSINRKNAQHIINLKNKEYIKNVEFTVSTIRNKAEDENINSYKMLIRQNNIKLRFAYSHAKIILAKTENDYFIIETSANLINAAKYEHYVISNDKKLYEYYQMAISKIEDKSFEQ